MEEESSSSRDSEEVLGAAQRLLQLSNDDDDNSSNVVDVFGTVKVNKKTKKDDDGDGGKEDEEVDQKICQIESTIWLKIEEIFGKDDEKDCCDRHYSLISRPKKRRFRSIQSIYMKTKPININGRLSAKTIVGN